MTDPDTKLLQEMLDRKEMSGWQVLDALYTQRFKDTKLDGVTPWLTDSDVKHLLGDAMVRCLEDVELGIETIARLVAAVLKLGGIGA